MRYSDDAITNELCKALVDGDSTEFNRLIKSTESSYQKASSELDEDIQEILKSLSDEFGVFSRACEVKQFLDDNNKSIVYQSELFKSLKNYVEDDDSLEKAKFDEDGLDEEDEEPSADEVSKKGDTGNEPPCDNKKDCKKSKDEELEEEMNKGWCDWDNYAFNNSSMNAINGWGD